MDLSRYNRPPTKEEIAAARRMSPEDKLLAGPRLFDEECRRLTEEIRREFPNADAKEQQRILNECLDEIHDRKGKEYCLSLGLIP